MSPSSASLRKHRRQSANLRMYARGRPHKWQRLRSRTLYFGGFCSFAIFAVVAILFQLSALTERHADELQPASVLQHRLHDYEARNGIPINWRSFRASSSVFAVVTTDTFMPRALSTFM